MAQKQVDKKIKTIAIEKKRKKSDLWFYIIITILLATMFLWYTRQMGYLHLWTDNQPSALIAGIDPVVTERRTDFKIINAHEHVQSFSNIPLLLKVMEDCQIEKMILLGTSKYTFYLNPKYGFSEYDKNNEEIIDISKKYPDKFIVLCTIDPRDKDKLEKLKKFITAGAKGLKLYNGHAYFYDNFFHLPLDDPGMMEVYQYCEEQRIPILYHINSDRFLSQMERILQAFPDLVVIAPHFILTSRNLTLLSRLLDTYPNLYTDISFGHPDFQVAGFKRISYNVVAFQEFIQKYRDRINFGTDIVITSYRAKGRGYIDDVTLSYFDMMEKEEFTLPDSIYKMMSKKAREQINPKTIYKGLYLDDETLRMIYHDNAERIFGK
ncbi:MAG: amidohydrolase family protein [Atribacterota bacterium]|nr:amidohydrolase family protein [Atribacterota bacterium]